MLHSTVLYLLLSLLHDSDGDAVRVPPHAAAIEAQPDRGSVVPSCLGVIDGAPVVHLLCAQVARALCPGVGEAGGGWRRCVLEAECR